MGGAIVSSSSVSPANMTQQLRRMEDRGRKGEKREKKERRVEGGGTSMSSAIVHWISGLTSKHDSRHPEPRLYRL